MMSLLFGFLKGIYETLFGASDSTAGPQNHYQNYSRSSLVDSAAREPLFNQSDLGLQYSSKQFSTPPTSSQSSFKPATSSDKPSPCYPHSKSFVMTSQVASTPAPSSSSSSIRQNSLSSPLINSSRKESSASVTQSSLKPESLSKQTISSPSPSSLEHATLSPRPLPSSRLSTLPLQPSLLFPTSAQSSSKPSPSSVQHETYLKPKGPSPEPPTPSPKPAAADLKPPSPSTSPSPPPSNSLPHLKPTLSPSSFDSANKLKKGEYICVQRDNLPIYMIPKNIQEMIKKDIVPEVLKMPLSPSTYEDYFRALLYAEDHYIEKWSDFQLVNVTLKTEKASIRKMSRGSICEGDEVTEDKTFVALVITCPPKERPFLLSRDFVFAKPSGRNVEPFKGIVYRVVKSTTVLVEFGQDFHYQHQSARRYDISFSFNRVCLKRAHQAIAASSDPLFQKFLFPNSSHGNQSLSSKIPYVYNHKLDMYQNFAVCGIFQCEGPTPHLIEGPLCITNVKNSWSNAKQLSRTGEVIREAVIKIYRHSPESKVLVCAPLNSTCDVLTSSLKEDIPEGDVFRANAAFREIEEVPLDILASCTYERDCFTCPPLRELKRYRVIFSTYMSSYRLHNEGIAAGHFSYIFLLDASSAIEPESMVPLANLADDRTAVIVTGEDRNRPRWVRSDMAREKGLKISYFERLRNREPYRTLDSTYITQLRISKENEDGPCSFMSFS